MFHRNRKRSAQTEAILSFFESEGAQPSPATDRFLSAMELLAVLNGLEGRGPSSAALEMAEDGLRRRHSTDRRLHLEFGLHSSSNAGTADLTVAGLSVSALAVALKDVSEGEEAWVLSKDPHHGCDIFVGSRHVLSEAVEAPSDLRIDDEIIPQLSAWSIFGEELELVPLTYRLGETGWLTWATVKEARSRVLPHGIGRIESGGFRLEPETLDVAGLPVPMAPPGLVDLDLGAAKDLEGRARVTVRLDSRLRTALRERAVRQIRRWARGLHSPGYHGFTSSPVSVIVDGDTIRFDTDVDMALVLGLAHLTRELTAVAVSGASIAIDVAER